MSILDDIIAQKRKEISEQNKKNWSSFETFKAISFLSKLNEEKLHLIAEVKKASPSKGIIYNDFNPINLATEFEKNGASCISVLTDQLFFKGHKDYLTKIKKTVELPILRKDFIIDPLQVTETKMIGADVMLLILDILSIGQANELIDAAQNENIEVLIEIHSQSTLNKLNEINHKPIVGINNRDLHTFSCDTNRTLTMSKIIREMDPSIKIIAESGYSEPEEMEILEKNDINGVLIGEGLSKNKNLLGWFKK